MSMNNQGRPSSVEGAQSPQTGFETFTGHEGLSHLEPLIFEIGDKNSTGVDFPDVPQVASRLGGLDRDLDGADDIDLPGLSEPETMLTAASRMPGLDGQKMSKSYNNTITLREDADSVCKKMRTMPTDPARVRRTDPGDPGKCPVWQFHVVYSDDKTREWVQEGCKTAGIGCLECKQPVIDAVISEQEPMHARAKMYEEDPTLVRNIIADGCEKANVLAEETMRDVREAMGLDYP